VLSGITFVNRNGFRWRDAPREHGPAKTLIPPRIRSLLTGGTCRVLFRRSCDHDGDR
jgi:transposase